MEFKNIYFRVTGWKQISMMAAFKCQVSSVLLLAWQNPWPQHQAKCSDKADLIGWSTGNCKFRRWERKQMNVYQIILNCKACKNLPSSLRQINAHLYLPKNPHQRNSIVKMVGHWLTIEGNNQTTIIYSGRGPQDNSQVGRPGTTPSVDASSDRW